MLVRRATPADARSIAAIHVRSWQTAYQGIVPEQFLGSLSVDQRERGWRQSLQTGESDVWVAAGDHGDVCGWVSVAPSRDPGASPSTAELWAIYVAPTHWRRGVGQRLWDEAEGHLRRSGFSDVTLWVLKDNIPAQAFYLANGFVIEPGVEKTIVLGGTHLIEIRLRKGLGK